VSNLVLLSFIVSEIPFFKQTCIISYPLYGYIYYILLLISYPLYGYIYYILWYWVLMQSSWSKYHVFVINSQTNSSMRECIYVLLI